MLEAHVVAQQIIAALAPLMPVLTRHDKDLAGQLRRAANSILLNVGEGQRRRGGDRTYHFTVASGSADESRSVLDAAKAWRIPLDDREARALIDRELGLLYGLIYGPKRLRVG